MKSTRAQSFLAAMLAATLITGCATSSRDITPAEARAIAKEAYIYGFPLIDSYRIQHSYFVDRGGPEYKAPWNTPNG